MENTIVSFIHTLFIIIINSYFASGIKEGRFCCWWPTFNAISPCSLRANPQLFSMETANDGQSATLKTCPVLYMGIDQSKKENANENSCSVSFFVNLIWNVRKTRAGIYGPGELIFNYLARHFLAFGLYVAEHCGKSVISRVLRDSDSSTLAAQKPSEKFANCAMFFSFFRFPRWICASVDLTRSNEISDIINDTFRKRLWLEPG